MIITSLYRLTDLSNDPHVIGSHIAVVFNVGYCDKFALLNVMSNNKITKIVTIMVATNIYIPSYPSNYLGLPSWFFLLHTCFHENKKPVTSGRHLLHDARFIFEKSE